MSVGQKKNFVVLRLENLFLEFFLLFMANVHQGVDSRWFGGNEFLRLNWQLQANCRQLVAVVVLLHVGAHLGWGFCALVMNFSWESVESVESASNP